MPDSALLSTEASGAVGQPVAHDSADLHVAGEAIYVDDIPEPRGCLHAFILQSPHAHARIRRIDTSACAGPGVHAVLTAADIPGRNEVAPVFDGDPVFAEDAVHYAGQSVLAVAAESIALARAAAQRAIVEYEPLPAILDVDAAVAAEAYVGAPYAMRCGDAEAALREASHRLEGQFDIGGQDHFYLEGQIALAVPQEAGGMLCYSSTQHPTEVQHLIARVLDRPDNAVVCEVRRMGGGFGGKESQASLIACVAALLANAIRRPVKLRLDRDDDMTLTGKRHDFRTRYRIGFDDDGRIQGVAMDLRARCGMSADLSNAVVDRALFHADNAYYLGHADIQSYRCKTHTVSNTAFRGFGGPQGVLSIEYAIDSVARSLGKDPLDVRLANLYDPIGAPGGRNRTHYGMTVEDNILHELLPELARRCDYRARRAAIRDFNAQSPVLKKGLALTPVKFGIAFTLTQLNQAGALVHVYTDGSVQLNHGGTEMGQGLHTKVSQVVAQAFGIDLARVRITATHTGKVPNTSATAASSGTDLNGMAALDAARKIKHRLIAFAAEHFGQPEAAVAFAGNRVRIGASHDLGFAELVKLAHAHRIPLSATGFFKTPKIAWDRAAGRGRPFLYFAYGAAASEVLIDTLTGEHTVLRADILHDVGRSLNPAIDIGQIEGGYVQGLGWLTTEELVWDAQGRLRTHAPSTYKIPTGRDMPREFHVELYGQENPEQTVHRSKAVGEPPLMLAISAFLALRDAVAACSDSPNALPQLDAPATPERMLMAIEALRSSSS